jgi:hypothetical protein
MDVHREGEDDYFQSNNEQFYEYCSQITQLKDLDKNQQDKIFFDIFRVGMDLTRFIENNDFYNLGENKSTLYNLFSNSFLDLIPKRPGSETYVESLRNNLRIFINNLGDMILTTNNPQKFPYLEEPRLLEKIRLSTMPFSAAENLEDFFNKMKKDEYAGEEFSPEEKKIIFERGFLLGKFIASLLKFPQESEDVFIRAFGLEGPLNERKVNIEEIRTIMALLFSGNNFQEDLNLNNFLKGRNLTPIEMNKFRSYITENSSPINVFKEIFSSLKKIILNLIHH